MTRYLITVAALIAFAGCTTAEAKVQTCSLSLGNGTRATVRIDDTGRSISMLGLDLTQAVGGSMHECSFGARRGDKQSRWSGSGASTNITIEDPDTGSFETVVQRYKGDLQLSISAPGGDLAMCGTIAVPGVLIVTPKPKGSCAVRVLRRT